MSNRTKRPRLEPAEGAADARENESASAGTPGRGSGDVLPFIFKHISSVKDKVRLERVCKVFQYHAKSSLAWSNVKRVSVVYDEDDDDEFGRFDDFFFYEINDELVSDC